MNQLEPSTNYRILHFLSPVKWKGKTFMNAHDANWKVAAKTIDFLPECHHFVVVPLKHTIKKQPNMTFIPYDYPRSALINRCMFDYRNIEFDFTVHDIDFVFTHEPCHLNAIKSWFHTNRYSEDVKYFSFYHWIYCRKSQGSTSCPSFYMRQLEGMTLSDKSFVHSPNSMGYMYDNFKKLGYKPVIPDNKITYMPLSGRGEVLSSSSEKYKNVLVFNHRYNKSSGTKRFEKYLPLIPKKYTVWITDEKCKLESPNGGCKIVKKCCDPRLYDELMSNCHASLCFIDSYSTWNLSAQDALIRNKPLIAYKHHMIKDVIGGDYPYVFENEEEFLRLLEEVPSSVSGYSQKLKEHDVTFKKNLITSLNENWRDNERVTPKDVPNWKAEIAKGNDKKKSICKAVKPNVRLNSSNHYIRRNLLHHGYKDDYLSSETRYIKL